MHYTELLRGVNAYASGNQNRGNVFPNQLYPEEAFYFEALPRPITTDRAVTFLKKLNPRVHIDKGQLQTAYGNVPIDVLNWILEGLALWENKTQITPLFSGFAAAVKYTGAAKALHILNPRFFMMWDVKIRCGYGCYCEAEGYFNFLWRSQREIQEIRRTYTGDYPGNQEISQRIYAGRVKSVLKLLDEYNYARYTKGWI